MNRGGEPAKIALGLLKLTVPLLVLHHDDDPLNPHAENLRYGDYADKADRARNRAKTSTGTVPVGKGNSRCSDTGELDEGEFAEDTEPGRTSREGSAVRWPPATPGTSLTCRTGHAGRL